VITFFEGFITMPPNGWPLSGLAVIRFVVTILAGI
jgi:hypothetical protein